MSANARDRSEKITRRGLAAPVARLGVILPTSNRLIEPQFVHFAPENLGVHFSRAQITGKWSKPLHGLVPEIARSAQAIADAKPNLIVFNCTATSMKEGGKGDEFLIDLIQRETKIEVTSTAQAVVEALRAMHLRKIVLVTPYVQTQNEQGKRYLREFGIDVVHDVGLGLKGGDDYIAISPEQWVEIALANDRPDGEGFLLACTNTTQIQAIDRIEFRAGKPVIASNQAALWAALNRVSRHVSGLQAATIPGELAACRA